MLVEVLIRNIALVDELRIGFEPGLNVLTGETGAGKSVIVGSLMQILGERADVKAIREGAKSGLIEGCFDCGRLKDVKRLLDERGIGMDDDGLIIIRREISVDGKNRCYINGQMTTLSFLGELGDLLVDIHSQNDHQSLLKKSNHTDLLDSYGGLWSEREAISESYGRLRQLRDELADLSRSEEEKERARETGRFYLKEIESAELQPGEDEELRNRKRILANSEELHRLLSSVCSELEEDDASAIGRLQTALRDLRAAAAIDGSLSGAVEMLREGLVNAEEAAAEAMSRKDATDFSPDELEAIEERLHLIHGLKRKYGESIEEVLRYRDKLAEDIRKLDHREEEIARLQKEIAVLEKELMKLSEALSKKRKACGEKLGKLIVKELKQLGMANGDFQVHIERRELSASGIDGIEFLISPNVGEKLKPLREIASSGEISRIMLAIKAVLGENDKTPVLVFDEIDVNIGGNTAVTVGEKLSGLGRRHQVLCITHLPQVAKYADVHFRVKKEVRKGRTVTMVGRLDEKEKKGELARMLGSSEDDATSARLVEKMMKSGKGGK